MYENAKVIPVEIFQKLGGGIKEDGRRGEFKYIHWIHYKNLCESHNVPHPAQQ
jgi:hypothetical protein